jgi:hypothetical protein
MAMSDAAREGLRIAVGRNPRQARAFLTILLAAPSHVRRKPDDRYGPLSLMLGTRPVLTPSEAAACSRFQREWIAGEFDIPELAAAVLMALRERGHGLSDAEVVAVARGRWQVVRPA